MTPTDELTAAAKLLRTLATAASTASDGTPTAAWNSRPCWPNNPNSNSSYLYGDYLTRDDSSTIAWPLLLRGGSQHRQAHMETQHAAYASAMGPGVGLALADWLEAVADGMSIAEVTDYAALTVARQVLASVAAPETAPSSPAPSETGLPPALPCTDPRHTGSIREQLGCTGPDPATT
ncbi:hypothetical protein ACGFZA_31830 [Streptomyces sp. NPDC048211]|uniref:hypothetical protein n=1 Tax=Streptomyces sp. NPDC048211 TaxID=3365516 RepID=UPI003712A983